MGSIVKDPEVTQGAVMIYSKLEDNRDDLFKLAEKMEKNQRISGETQQLIYNKLNEQNIKSTHQGFWALSQELTIIIKQNIVKL